MSQCVHGRDVGFGFECWECEAEKRRHKEVLDLQQQGVEEQRRALEQQQRHHHELIEAQERQEELLREANEAQYQAARAQQDRLALQQRQIEEQRARQLAEEERLELRTGLPEFSEAFRHSWLHIAENREALGARVASLRSELSQLTTEKNALWQSVQQAWRRIHGDLAKELQSQLEGSTPRLEDPPPALGDAESKQRLAALLLQLRGISKSVGAKPAPILPSDGPLVQLYRELVVFAEKLQSFVKAPPKQRGMAIGCFAFLFLCMLVGLSMAFKQPSSSTVLATLFYVAVAAIPAYLVVGRIALIRRLSDACTSSRECLTSIEGFLGRMPEVELTPLAEWPQDAKPREVRVAGTANNAAISLKNTIVVLLEAYKTSNFSSHALAQQLAADNAEVGRKTTKIEELTKALEYSADDRTVLDRFEAMREEIRRIGRLILDGRRVPGHRLELVQCPVCGGPASSETKSCPYCGGPFA
ncbi:MAG TPA: hypothetical protein VF173_08235 [Thermoanaerobaculia bacterium]|nr:hypothetical protein [Thermoanaerobaculia bacterium]